MARRLALVCALVLITCGCSFALDAGGKGLRLSTGFFTLSDQYAKDTFGTGFAVNAEKVLAIDGDTQYFIGLGYATASNTVSDMMGYVAHARNSVVPLIMSMRVNVTPNREKRGIYAGFGVGLTYSDAEVSIDDAFGVSGNTILTVQRKLDPSFQLTACMESGSGAFAELKYLNGSEDLNTGWSFSVGARF